MPDEYKALLDALKETKTPVAEYAWKTRPEGAYYVISLDMESGNLNGDGEKLDRGFEGSLDLFYRKLADRKSLVSQTETILDNVCGSSWELNSTQYETETGLFHVEWVFEVFDGETEPEPDPEPGEGDG